MKPLFTVLFILFSAAPSAKANIPSRQATSVYAPTGKVTHTISDTVFCRSLGTDDTASFPCLRTCIVTVEFDIRRLDLLQNEFAGYYGDNAPLLTDVLPRILSSTDGTSCTPEEDKVLCAWKDVVSKFCYEALMEAIRGEASSGESLIHPINGAFSSSPVTVERQFGRLFVTFELRFEKLPRPLPFLPAP